MNKVNAMTMHVWTDDEEYVIAADETDARAVFRENDYMYPEDAELRQLPDDKLFPFRENEEDAEPVRKTCAEWANERGRGYFGCTVH